MGKLRQQLKDNNANRHPFFIAAGVIKEQDQIRRIATDPYLAATVVGDFTMRPNIGNGQAGRFQIFHHDPATGSAWNSAGLPNPGREAASGYLPEAIKILKASGQLAIIGVAALPGENTAKVLAEMTYWGLEMGADAVEIDGSCKNLGPDYPSIDKDLERVAEIDDSTRREVGSESTVGLKISDLALSEARDLAGANFSYDFIDSINAVGPELSPINPKTGRHYIEVNGGMASLSGLPIKDLARQSLKFLGEAFGGNSDIDLLTTGGIENGAEIFYREKKLHALLGGGAQQPYRVKDPRDVTQLWARGYNMADIIN